MKIQWKTSKTNAMQSIGMVDGEAHFIITEYPYASVLVSLKEKGRPNFTGGREACKGRAEQLMEALA